MARNLLAMDLVTILAAAEEGHDKSEAALFIAGGILAVFAVISGVIGIMKPDLAEGPNRAIMGIAVVLVVATMVASIAVS
jgi:hypothetical protein